MHETTWRTQRPSKRYGYTEMVLLHDVLEGSDVKLKQNFEFNLIFLIILLLIS